MPNQYLIGIDIGTQGTTAAIFDSQGNMVAQDFEPSLLKTPFPGVVEENPDVQLGSVMNTIKGCLQKIGDQKRQNIAAIAIDGQMAGIIGIDKSGRAITPYDSWLDTRCADELKRMNEAKGDQIILKNGAPASFNHGPKKLWWKKHHPDIYKKIAAFVQPGAYAAMRLCGLTADQAYIDNTYIHFSGFADNEKQTWDTDLCVEFSIDKNKFPKIVSPDEQIGTITKSVGEIVGLKTGVPVVAGCGDSAASFLGAGAVRNAISVDLAGTASVFCSTTDVYCPDVANRVLACGRAVVDGLWHNYAYINGGGQNLEWLKSNVVGFENTRNSQSFFDQMNSLAESLSEDSELPLFIPHLSGRVCPPEPDIRGAWIGICRNHRIEHFYRSVLESVALEYATYLKIIKTLQKNHAPVELRTTGGGSKSRVWNSIKANALNLPVLVLNNSKGATSGSAMLAGYGVGLFEKLPDTADNWVKVRERIEPDQKLKEFYQGRLARYVHYTQFLTSNKLNHESL